MTLFEINEIESMKNLILHGSLICLSLYNLKTVRDIVTKFPVVTNGTLEHIFNMY